MKRVLKSVAVLAAVTLASCGSTDMISVDAIEGSVRIVSDRHDEYVREDADLSEDERAIYLRSTELLRRVVDEAKR